MKSFTASFLFNISLLFLLFSLTLYVLGVSPFLFPHLPLYCTLLSYEKKRKKRLVTGITTLILFSFLSTPLPIPFLLLLATQLYIYTRLSFNVTTFDIPVVALMAAFSSGFIVNMNLAAMHFMTTGTVPFGNIALNLITSSAILLFLFITFKERINHIFTRDSWL